MNRSDPIEQGDEVFCQCCGVNRNAIVIDAGYGITEYWGSVSNHVDLRMVCQHCESEDIVDLESVPEPEEA